MLDQIKSHLFDSIIDIISTADRFVLHPEKDFSRKSQLTMKTMIQAIVSLIGKMLNLNSYQGQTSFAAGTFAPIPVLLSL